MSFVEFLMEYYIYILAVLIILIVGVIGFLVDSKNKEKKKASVNKSNTETTVATTGVNDGDVAMVNNVNDNSGVGQNVQPQVESNNNMTLNGMITENANVSSDGMMPVMENVQNNMGVVNDNGSMQTSMGNAAVNAVPVDNANVMATSQPAQYVSLDNGARGMPNDSNIINNVQSMQSTMNNLVGTQTSVMSGTSFGSELANGLSLSDMMARQNMQSSMSNIEVNQNQAPVQSVQFQVQPQEQVQMQPQAQLQGQAQVQSQGQFQTPIQVQSQVGMGINEVPMGNLNVGMNGMGNLNTGSAMNVVPNVQPVMQTTVPVMNNEVNNLENQSQVMSINNGQIQRNVSMNQPGMSNGFQAGIVPDGNVQSTDMAGQSVNNNLQSNSNVVTSNGSQPFDISSMFANNQ